MKKRKIHRVQRQGYCYMWIYKSGILDVRFSINCEMIGEEKKGCTLANPQQVLTNKNVREPEWEGQTNGK